MTERLRVLGHRVLLAALYGRRPSGRDPDHAPCWKASALTEAERSAGHPSGRDASAKTSIQATIAGGRGMLSLRPAFSRRSDGDPALGQTTPSQGGRPGQAAPPGQRFATSLVWHEFCFHVG